jgi:ApaG protein
MTREMGCNAGRGISCEQLELFADLQKRVSRRLFAEPRSEPMDTKRYEVTIEVRTTYVPEQSDEAGARYVFAYTITIRNTGTVTAQLISRHWIITDSDNHVQEVRGMGVVGEQPTLKPEESFEYTSGTAIATSVGTMRGSYQMMAEDGTAFDAPIPEFTLSIPRVLH